MTRRRVLQEAEPRDEYYDSAGRPRRWCNACERPVSPDHGGQYTFPNHKTYVVEVDPQTWSLCQRRADALQFSLDLIRKAIHEERLSELARLVAISVILNRDVPVPEAAVKIAREIQAAIDGRTS